MNFFYYSVVYSLRYAETSRSVVWSSCDLLLTVICSSVTSVTSWPFNGSKVSVRSFPSDGGVESTSLRFANMNRGGIPAPFSRLHHSRSATPCTSSGRNVVINSGPRYFIYSIRRDDVDNRRRAVITRTLLAVDHAIAITSWETQRLVRRKQCVCYGHLNGRHYSDARIIRMISPSNGHGE